MSELNTKPVLEVQELKKLLPHRYPFLLVDRVLSLGEKDIKALKNVTVNEPFFQGHFPQEPIMPGVLLIEALAQTAAILAIKNVTATSSDRDFSQAAVYFLSIDGAKFRRKVVPGDAVELCVTLTRPGTSRIAFEGKAYVDGALACEAKMMAMVGK